MRSLRQSVHDPSPLMDVRTRARANEIDRQVGSLRFRIRWVKYLALPILLMAAAVMFVGVVFGIGAADGVVAGTLGLVLAAAGLAALLRSQTRRLDDLTWKRDALRPGVISPESRPEFEREEA